MKIELTNEQIEELKKNYPKYGLLKSSKILNISPHILKRYIKEFNLIKNRKIEFSIFEKITQKEVVWFLGFLWADGSIYKDSIEISISEKDYDDVYRILSSFGNWNTRSRTRLLNNKNYICKTIYANDKKIREFLDEHNYKEKSLKSPTKILEKIPEKLKKYFFRGYIDGDGCFSYKNKNNNRHYFSLTGNINMDWSEVTELFKKLEIKYSLKILPRKTGNCSSIESYSQEDIIKIGNYIYDGEYDNIGLKRKFESFLHMKNNKKRINQWK